MAQTREQTAHTDVPVDEWLGNKLITLTDKVAEALTSVRFLTALFLITVGTLGALSYQVHKVEVAVERLADGFERLDQTIDKLDRKLNSIIGKLDRKLDDRIDKLDRKLNDRMDKLEEKLDQHTHGQSENDRN